MFFSIFITHWINLVGFVLSVFMYGMVLGFSSPNHAPPLLAGVFVGAVLTFLSVALGLMFRFPEVLLFIIYLLILDFFLIRGNVKWLWAKLLLEWLFILPVFIWIIGGSGYMNVLYVFPAVFLVTQLLRLPILSPKFKLHPPRPVAEYFKDEPKE